MKFVPFLIFAVVIILLVGYAARARRKQAATLTEQAERIGVGSAVMTTSGLHGTVATVNGDGTVQLAIAAGIEVRWEVAALRDASSLPAQYAHEPEADPGPV